MRRHAYNRAQASAAKIEQPKKTKLPINHIVPENPAQAKILEQLRKNRLAHTQRDHLNVPIQFKKVPGFPKNKFVKSVRESANVVQAQVVQIIDS